MATPRHLRCAALLSEGVEPVAAMIEAGWPTTFARAFAPYIVAWLRSADIEVCPPCAVDPEPEPDTPVGPDPEPEPVTSVPDLPLETDDDDNAPDDTASAEPDGTLSTAAVAPPVAAIGGEVHGSTDAPALRARRPRKH